MLPLDQLKLRDIESTFMSRRFMFALYSSEGRNVFKDFKVTTESPSALTNKFVNTLAF